MADSSYYLLRYPLEGTASPSTRREFQESSGPPQLPVDPVATDHPESRSNVAFFESVPPRGQPFQKRLSNSEVSLWRTIKPPLEIALFPLAAIGYLAFCYTVHGKVVPINTYGLYTVTAQHLAIIKGGITSITIIVISIALYPVYDIIATLKGEEFFRILASRSHGVPLETINHISTPSFGDIDMLVAMWRHRCSNYYILGIAASLLILIVGTLAPGVLTIDSVLADGELMAFAIGAVSVQSVVNGSNPAGPMFNASLNSDLASSITWVEMELGGRYSFGIENTSDPDYSAYIAPVPLNLSTTTTARWMSDVIGLNPTCSWASTNLTAPVQTPFNSSSYFGQYFTTAHLLDFDLDVIVSGGDLSLSYTSFTTLKQPNSFVKNHTTQAIPSDGSTVFLLGWCQSGSGCPSNSVTVGLDFTGINTTFSVVLFDQTWSMAILACKPNITIETREVRNDGRGILSVQPLPSGRRFTRQGNLNTVQTTALFSVATMSLNTYGGSLPGTKLSYGLGSQVEGDVLFGKAQFENMPGIVSPLGTSITIRPAPIENITQGYTHILKSSAKSYLAGYLGTAYVPGRISQTELIFAASIPNLAVATGGLAFLALLIVLAHFRSKKDLQFTLVNVAAAVHGSELPAQFAQIEDEQTTAIGAHGNVDEIVATDDAPENVEGGATTDDSQDVMEIFAERRIFMEIRADDTPVLHMG